jgi:putative transposase
VARKREFLENCFPYHVTARTADREYFEHPVEEVWKAFTQFLFLMSFSYGIRIHAFVLMSNHFHLLMTAPDNNLNAALDYLIDHVNRSPARPEIEKTFQATIIRSRAYYKQAYKYVYRNPVEARLCEQVESYPFSTLRGVLGFDRQPFPVIDNMALITNPHAQLGWLNSPFPNAGFLEELREAMKRAEFEPLQALDQRF